MNYEASIVDEEHKKAIEEEIKITKETVATMKLARDDMRKFISSFEEGESLDTGESTSDVVKGENNNFFAAMLLSFSSIICYTTLRRRCSPCCKP